MLRLRKHFQKYAWMILLIIALLSMQAVCDLNLPSFTASIVNVGIQQQGVEHSAPVLVRESSLHAFMQWMPSADADRYVTPNYRPATAEELTAWSVLPQSEPILSLDNVTADVQAKLDDLFSKAMTIQGFASGQTEMNAEMPQGMTALFPANADGALPDISKIKESLAHMTDSQREAMLSQIGERLFAMLPEGMLAQAGNQAVRAEYEAMGMDLSRLQSRSIWQNGAAMLLIALLGTLAAVGAGYLGAKMSAKLGRDLRGKVFDKVLHFGQREMDSFSTASLITRSTNDIQQVQTVLVLLLRIVIYAPIIGIGGVLRALQTNPSMTWIIFAAVLTVIAIVSVMVSLAMPRFKRIQTLIDRVNQVMRETLTGLPVIRAFCTQKREEERFDEASSNLKKTQLFVNRLMGGMMPLMMLVMNGTSILIMWIGAHSIEGGGMQVGDMMAFIQYAMQIIMAFLMISMISVMLPRASVAAKRIQDVLDTEIQITDPQEAKAFDESQKGVVTFQNVSFQYPEADEDMLHDISFTALPGQTTAVLGGTGSGKSTLVNLIPRFFDATAGQILVDGVDVREAELSELRDRIGYVPQKGVLFTGTIRENIAFGSSAEIPDKTIEEAARIAQAKDFVLERDAGYDSEIAQGGTNVSGGQKQRLSIARAIAKDPEIFIFDDSFSALDFRTDAAVRSELGKATQNKTVLIVAQRISTVMRADQILVLDEGRLVGKGMHEELMESCEVYQQIATSQLSREELEHGK